MARLQTNHHFITKGSWNHRVYLRIRRMGEQGQRASREGYRRGIAFFGKGIEIGPTFIFLVSSSPRKMPRRHVQKLPKKRLETKKSRFARDFMAHFDTLTLYQNVSYKMPWLLLFDTLHTLILLHDTPRKYAFYRYF